MNSKKANISENTKENKPPTKVPTYLSHKPIYTIDDYAPIDGHYKGNTDVVGLSLGKAQWDKEKFVPSVKVFRYTNCKYSRQSEETTLTRAIDMVTLILMVLDKSYNGKEFKDNINMFGNVISVEEKGSNDLVEKLNLYLNNDKNKADIEAHIEWLEKTLKRYRS